MSARVCAVMSPSVPPVFGSLRTHERLRLLDATDGELHGVVARRSENAERVRCPGQARPLGPGTMCGAYIGDGLESHLRRWLVAKIPMDAVHARRVRAGERAHDRAARRRGS